MQILVWTISTFEWKCWLIIKTTSKGILVWNFDIKYSQLIVVWTGFKGFFFQRMHWSELFWVISSIILGSFATWIGSYYRLYNVLHIYLNSSTHAIYINESNIISKCQHFWSTMAKCDKTSACEDAKMCAITSFRVFFNIGRTHCNEFYIHLYIHLQLLAIVYDIEKVVNRSLP